MYSSYICSTTLEGPWDLSHIPLGSQVTGDLGLVRDTIVIVIGIWCVYDEYEDGRVSEIYFPRWPNYMKQ